jgi:hypothetical protein
VGLPSSTADSVAESNVLCEGLNATAYLTAKLHWRLGISSVLRNTPQEQMGRMRIGGSESMEPSIGDI